MDGQQHQIKKAVEDIGEQLKEKGVDGLEIESKFKKITTDYAKESASARQAMGLTDAMVEGIYGQAYRLYNTGKYKDSSQLFRLLIMLDAKQPKYALGLAACFHMLKEFQNALPIYTLCGILDPESPLPHYHISDCYIQMGDKISAIISLELAINRAEGKAEYQILKDRAELTVENLKKEIAPQQL